MKDTFAFAILLILGLIEVWYYLYLIRVYY